MNVLYKEYLKINPDIKKVYVDPNINNSLNEYLSELYKGIDTKLELKSINKIGYVKLFFNKITGEKSLLHHHWFEINNFRQGLVVLWKLIWIFIYILWGGKVVWTIHNEHPHNRKYFFINKVIRILFAKIVTKLHVHCIQAIPIMSKVLKISENKFFVVKHPNYRVNIYSKEKAINNFLESYPKINIDYNKKIFLVFGQLAEYKGIIELMEIMKMIKDPFILIIAGRVKRGNDIYAKRMDTYRKYENFIFIDEFIKDENVAVLFNMSDCVLFNYLRILTSGGVILSLNYKKYTIAPNKACIGEIKNKYLHLFDDEKQLKNEINKVINFI